MSAPFGASARTQMAVNPVGLSNLVLAAVTTTVLMLVLYLLSNLVLYRGLLPLSSAFPVPKLSRPLFYLLILPGTVIHELSHLAACVISRVRVYEVHLFDPQPNGVVGQVVYERCDPVRRNLIAFAPFLGGSLTLYLVTLLAFAGTGVSDLTRVPVRGEDLWGSLGLMLGAVLSTIASADPGKVTTWLFFYLAFSVGYGIAPSRTDLSHLVADGVLVIALSLVLYLADVVWHLGLVHNEFFNATAAGLAALLAGLNRLLLFSSVVIGLGAAVLVPVATILHGLRRRSRG